jgi:uncharacterized protein YndB with AHSA1/START domain
MMTAWLMLGIALGAPSPQSAATAPVSVTKMAGPPKALRLEVIVPASLDDVWAAFTTEAGVAAWLWSDVKIDLRDGGDWLVRYPGGATGGGTILSFVPKHRLTLAAMAPEQFPTVRRERTTAVFDFESLTAASTRVRLVQSGWKDGREWDEAYEYLAVGNATLLTQLYRRFVAGPIDWTKPR